MNRKIIRYYYKFLLFSMVGLCLIYELSSFHTEIMIGCVALGAPVWLLMFGSISKKKQLLLMFSLLFLLIVVFYKIMGISTCDNDAISTYINWTIVLVFAIYLPSFFFSKRETTYLIYLIYSLIIVQLISAIVAGNSLVSAGDTDTESVRITEFGSMAMFFASGCLLWFFYDNKLFHKLLSIIGIALSLYVIFAIQQRAINAICSVIMLVAIFLVNNKSKKKLLTFGFLFIVLLLILYLSGTYISIMDFLIESIPSVRLSERIADVKDFLMTGDLFAHDRFSGRSDLLSVSISSWLKDPISFLFGVGDHRGNNTVIGNHSEFIDLLARYGLFGEILYVVTTFLFVGFLLSFCRNYTRVRPQIWIISGIFVFRNIVGIVSVYEVAIPLLLFTQAVLFTPNVKAKQGFYTQIISFKRVCE